MGESFFLFDILLFAVIAAFLVFRLRNVLGRRTGLEQRRQNPLASPPRAPDPRAEPSDNVVTLPERPRDAAPPVAEPGAATGLTQIKIADRSFNERGFLDGARAAFGMIVDAFARGDTGTLRPLLSDDLYDEFSEAIRARLASGETLEHKIESIESAEILEARMDGRTAYVTVKFVTRQTNATRDAQGAVTDGNPDKVIEVTDIWTFARNTRASDPNWTLVETRTPN
jgi:predicted lipid-binding transport protein (Tim44 family)